MKELRKAAQSGFDSARKNISENKDAKKAKAVFCASMSAAQYNSKHNRNKKNENTKEIMVPSSNNKFFGANDSGDSRRGSCLNLRFVFHVEYLQHSVDREIDLHVVSWHTATNRVPIGDYLRPVLELVPVIIPPLGALDLSPILAFTALNFFTSTAAALPAQIDGEGNIVGVAEKKNNAFKGFLFAAKKEEKFIIIYTFALLLLLLILSLLLSLLLTYHYHSNNYLTNTELLLHLLFYSLSLSFSFYDMSSSIVRASCFD